MALSRSVSLNLYLFIFLCNFKNGITEELLLDRFHICTIASRSHPNLNKLEESCQKHHIELEVIGLGLPYAGNSTKLIYMLEYLLTLEEDEIVMFVDAFDVLVVADKKTILKKFLDMEIPLLISTEKNCFPYPDLADHYPSSPTPFKYINSGCYIGYVGHLKQWMMSFFPIKEGIGDQGIITKQFLSSLSTRPFLHLDYYCQIFLSLYLVEREEIVIDTEKKG